MSLDADLHGLLAEEPIDLARAALTIARLEYPQLGFAASLDTLDRIGERAAARLGPDAGAPLRTRVAALNQLVFDEEGFAGHRTPHDDFRNSCLNVVLERRIGIPITLALVYIEVARRAGLTVLGVGFPGHFLMRVPAGEHPGDARDLILDPFNGGAEIDAEDCRALLARHLGLMNEDVPMAPSLLRPCPPRHMLARMLNNLKRTYVDLRSFPQARRVTNLLLTIDPTLLSEVRDRGLLAYRLDDFPAALRDLESYLRLSPKIDDPGREEWQQLWDHVKTLRRRVAGLN
jgi:regulator of sirC expression with transglutaminase-like and TPR domain